jgi:hypothetical protein
MNIGFAGLDDRIGLCFTDGSVRYFFRSTLANACGYFSARFGNDLGEGRAYTDEQNQLIYTMERDGELFAKYIEPFILKRKRPHRLPTFSQDPELWRALRDETEFYGLNELSQILSVTHSCPHSKGNDQGILYWIGTDKGKREYRNPQATGAIAVHVGKIGDLTFAERTILKTSGEGQLSPAAFTQESRQALVQYRPQIIGLKEDGMIDLRAEKSCFSMWCNLSRCQIPTIVDLKNIEVRLATYSLRYERGGMTDWNLEGSKDGKEWIVLHKARNDHHVALMDENLEQMWLSELHECTDNEMKVKISQEFAERERRHAWQIDGPQSQTFFRFFRIIGSGINYERHENSYNCLHGVGLELYGDVHEE